MWATTQLSGIGGFGFIRNHSVESDAPQIAGSRRPRSFNGAGPALFSFQGFGPVLAPLIVGLAADLGFDRGTIPLNSLMLSALMATYRSESRSECWR
jgi:hypothetical protein